MESLAGWRGVLPRVLVHGGDAGRRARRGCTSDTCPPRVLDGRRRPVIPGQRWHRHAKRLGVAHRPYLQVRVLEAVPVCHIDLQVGHVVPYQRQEVLCVGATERQRNPRGPARGCDRAARVVLQQPVELFSGVHCIDAADADLQGDAMNNVVQRQPPGVGEPQLQQIDTRVLPPVQLYMGAPSPYPVRAGMSRCTVHANKISGRQSVGVGDPWQPAGEGQAAGGPRVLGRDRVVEGHRHQETPSANLLNPMDQATSALIKPRDGRRRDAPFRVSRKHF